MDHINYKIVDNFLKKEDFEYLKNIVTGNNFGYFFQNKTVCERKPDDDNFYFTHNVFNDLVKSKFFEDFNNILISKIEMFVLKRIKVNCYPRTSKIIYHEKHVDYYVPHKGFILYFNTCNGFTILENDIKIESIENRALFFDSSKLHSSTSCTDSKARFNVNINYI